jgi:phosphopantothenoylcysteine synthetase/decarboxylase
VLVTAGGTREWIDDVRCIANTSTGKTGAALADAFARFGWETVLLRAQSAVPARELSVTTHTYVTSADLDTRLQALLGNDPFDTVVHAAAVSDFLVAAVTVDGVAWPVGTAGKLDSAREVSVTLRPGKKLIQALHGYSHNPALQVVGFKLTGGASDTEREAAVEKLFASTPLALVVHNDLAEWQSGHHPFTLCAPGGDRTPCADVAALAESLRTYFERQP